MKKLIYFSLVLFLLSSCYSIKDLNYIQNDDFSTNKVTTYHNRRIIYEVQPNDILSIRVQSLDPTQSAFFNMEAVSGIGGGGGGGGNQSSNAALFLSGYSIDERGFINLPIVGLMKVSSLTIDEIQRLIQQEINKYLLDAIVLVKLVSFKVTVLGDVGNPGTYFIYNTQATVFEALSLAGDLRLSANRYEVKLIRQIEDSGNVILLDLTDPKLLESPYYYLSPNDVLYIEPLKKSSTRTNLPVLTAFFAGISTLILVLNYIDTN